MPSRVRAFWWLSVAIAALWIYWTAHSLLYPSHRSLEALARIPAAHREELHNLVTRMTVYPALFWVVITLGLAWLGAFRRQNWARWAFVIVFLVREVGLRLVVLVVVWQSHLHSRRDFAGLANPLTYVIPALTIAAIYCVFTGDAQPWFRKPATARNARVAATD